MTERRRPLTPAEAEAIANPTESLFALVLTSIRHLRVHHQPKPIETAAGNTQPDFFVKNSRNPNSKGVYVEVTRGSNDKPHKKRQLKVMRKAGLPYVQLDGDNMKKIAAANGLEEG